MPEIVGKLDAAGARFAIVVGRFNELISQKLLGGALDALARHGADDKDVTIVWVPGALEIPLAAQRLADTKKYDAIITLGAVIQGDTPHFDIVAAESAKGVAQMSLAYKLPIVNGILTTNTIDQAIERAGTKAGNKGYDAAVTAIDMVNVLKKIK